MVVAIDRVLMDHVISGRTSLLICVKTNSSTGIHKQSHELLDELLQLISTQPKVTVFVHTDDIKRKMFYNKSLWIVDGFDSFR